MTTVKPAPAGSMVLPPHVPSSGEIADHRWPHSSDARVPHPLVDHKEDRWGEDYPAKVVDHIERNDHCPTGRHLFDIIESAIWREKYDGDEYLGDEAQFRARLTCVRCGLVLGWEGTRVETNAQHLDPTPLTAGELTAQHVSGARDNGWGTDTSNWTIYRDSAAVGAIAWGCTQRGRRFHTARLHSWAEGQTVEGPNPLAALRKVCRQADAPTGVDAAC